MLCPGRAGPTPRPVQLRGVLTAIAIFLTAAGNLSRWQHHGLAIWGNKGYTPEFVQGLLQETARDSGHANMALAGMVDAAETARQQGIDIYGEEATRIMAAMEYQAQFLPPHNAKPPEKLEFHAHPTWEIAYNHYYGRMGYALPKMAAVLALIRPTGVNHHMAWETLTHAGMGAIGLPPLDGDKTRGKGAHR